MLFKTALVINIKRALEHVKKYWVLGLSLYFTNILENIQQNKFFCIVFLNFKNNSIVGVFFKELTTIGKSDNPADIERAKELKFAFSCLVKKVQEIKKKRL